jgi:GxxExxY protein
VYEVTLAYELGQRGLKVRRQVPIPIRYDDLKFEEGFRADMMVEDLVILEIKSVDALHPVHGKQLLTYLRLADKRLGYLMNFGEALIKDGIRRVVNGAEDWGKRGGGTRSR